MLLAYFAETFNCFFVMFQWFNCQCFKLFHLEKKWFRVWNFQLNTERPISISGSLSVVGKIGELFEKQPAAPLNTINNCKTIETTNSTIPIVKILIRVKYLKTFSAPKHHRRELQQRHAGHRGAGGHSELRCHWNAKGHQCHHRQYHSYSHRENNLKMYSG